MCIIVQTQAHIFRNDWELEFDGLEPLTVGLPFLINLDFGKQRFHKLPLFLIVHDGIELIKVNQHLVDVVACQLFRLNRHLLSSGGNELVFCMQVKLTIGERLKDLRVERKLTLEQLAAEVSISKSALGKYESDNGKDISPYSILLLADYYGVSCDYLMGRTETKNHPNTALHELHLSDA